MRRVYAERHERIVQVLTRDFDGCLTPLPSTGGLHLAALFPRRPGAPDRAVAERAAAQGVAVFPLSYHFVDTPPRPGLLFGYGAIPSDRIEEGLRRLRVCLEPAAELSAAPPAPRDPERAQPAARARPRGR
jgi:GntR family transcriptional regulator/MocR family aminotransferase